jgi:hypothetical protein
LPDGELAFFEEFEIICENKGWLFTPNSVVYLEHEE